MGREVGRWAGRAVGRELERWAGRALWREEERLEEALELDLEERLGWLLERWFLCAAMGVATGGVAMARAVEADSLWAWLGAARVHRASAIRVMGKLAFFMAKTPMEWGLGNKQIGCHPKGPPGGAMGGVRAGLSSPQVTGACSSQGPQALGRITLGLIPRPEMGERERWAGREPRPERDRTPWPITVNHTPIWARRLGRWSRGNSGRHFC